MGIFFNVDAQRLAAGYRRGAEYTEREEREGKNCLTELYWIIRHRKILHPVPSPLLYLPNFDGLVGATASE
jgi:hypothetical protein